MFNDAKVVIFLRKMTVKSEKQMRKEPEMKKNDYLCQVIARKTEI